jgi:ribosomal protein S18 acetylase RimI-like enzyme
MSPALSPPEVRRAAEDDVPRVAATLARAFQEDPVACWACPRDALRPRVLERFFAAMAGMLVRHEEVWITSGCEGAAVWAPPGDWGMTLRDLPAIARALMFPSVLWRMPLVGFGLGTVELKHPRTEPHFYLADLGTDPDHRGRGIASALLQPTLAFCDREGVAAYLEASSARNVGFYERHGFALVREIKLPRGPIVYPMWRKAR